MSDLSRAELEGLHGVLRRSLERMERKVRNRTHGDNDNAPDPAAAKLAAEVAAIADELAGY